MARVRPLSGRREAFIPKTPRPRRAALRLLVPPPTGTVAALALFAGVLAPAAAQVPATTGFTLSDQTSEVYYRQVIAAGEEVRIEGGAEVAGAVHSNGNADVKRGAVVSGDLTASGKIADRGRVEGDVVESAPELSLPALFDEAAMRQRADHVEEGDATFEDAAIDGIVFVDGNVRIRGNLNGEGTIFATGDIRFDTVGPPGAFELDESTRISLVAARDVRIAEDRPFRGVARAGRDVSLESHVVFDGVVVAGRTVHVKRGATVTFVDFDTVAPEIELLEPIADAFLAVATPTIRLTATDEFSGLRAGSFTLSLDGEEVTTEATGIPARLELAFEPPAPLAEGPHTLEASVLDHSDNEGLATFAFSVDTLPPDLGITAPVEGAVIRERRPEVTVTFSDAGSGADPATLRVALDGVDLTASCEVSAGSATCGPTEDLLDGPHTITAEIRDAVGNLATASSGFEILVDQVPPTLAVVAPVASRIEGSVTPVLVIEYQDADSGIDPTSFTLTAGTAGGVDLTGSCIAGASEARCEPTLTEGPHRFVASVEDRAGNAASAAKKLVLSLDPPTVAIASPDDGLLTGEPIVEVTGTFSDDGGVSRVFVNRVEAELDGDAFRADVPLDSLGNRVVATAVDRAGNRGSDFVVVTLDDAVPVIELETPAQGQLTNRASIAVAGRVSDLFGVERMELDGTELVLDPDDRFSVEVPLPEGESTLLLRATDVVGNVAELPVAVERLTLPSVTVAAPAQGALVAADAVTVAGTVGETVSQVSVNGIPATLAAGRFEAEGVPVVAGFNVLTAEATTPAGLTARALVTVFHDETPPRVEIVSPAPGTVVTSSRVAVRGLVNDLSAAIDEPAAPTVTVDGIPAQVGGVSFLVPEVELAPGANVLTAVATDASGNVARSSVEVIFEPPAGPVIREVSGNAQTGVIGSTLPAPLAVRLEDADGRPVAEHPVLFEVMRNDGHLGGGRRLVAAVTDAVGVARAEYTVGNRVGEGNQRVDAFAVGFEGRVSFFASTIAGTPDDLHMDSGDQQVWSAGDVLPLPLVATVTDAGSNRLEGIPVTFEVVEGEGSFPAGGGRELTVVSDSSGRASAAFRLAEDEGLANNVVRAKIDTPEGTRFTSFFASGLAAGDPAETSISGVVLDNSDQPVPGVTLHIAGTSLSTRSEEDGSFRLEGVPPGHLRLEADGTTTTRAGTWPHLEFEMSVVPGRDNGLGRPIFMLPLDTDRGLFVSETDGGTLTLPELPGFALEVAPGSVTFPDGSRSGTVSVTMVHSDKVPMTPNFGQQPRFVVTIQPAGATFDPPARLSLPNVDGLAPGQSTELYSFDHDLAAFVAIGTATVSADGTTVVSDPGVGVLEAGWHCGGDPASGGTPHDCPECQECDPSSGACVPVSGSCDDEQFCTSANGDSPGSDVCENGSCKGRKIEDRVLSTGFDVGLPPALVENLDRVTAVVSLVPGCELEEADDGLGLDLNISATEIRKCCEKEKKMTTASQLSGGVGVGLTAECNIPGLSLPTKTIEVGVQGTVSVKGQFAVSGEENGCEGCSWELSGGVGVTPALGVEVELPFDILEANLDAEYGGSFNGTFKCGEGDLFGCIGPLAIVGTINFADLLTESVRWEVPGTQVCRGKEE